MHSIVWKIKIEAKRKIKCYIPVGNSRGRILPRFRSHLKSFPCLKNTFSRSLSCVSLERLPTNSCAAILLNFAPCHSFFRSACKRRPSAHCVVGYEYKQKVVQRSAPVTHYLCLTTVLQEGAKWGAQFQFADKKTSLEPNFPAKKIFLDFYQ